MLVDCIYGDFSDPEAVSGSSTIKYLSRAQISNPDLAEVFFVVNRSLKTKKRTGNCEESRFLCLCGVWSLYFGKSIFVFGFCITFVFKSYLYNKR